MFCSRPAGSAPDVTGPYCSQTTSGAAPPEAWLSTAAFAALMLPVLFGSHWTVTFLCAASYWVVSCFRPALSAAVIGPVFGGSTILIVTGALLPEPPGLAEPPPEHPATRTLAVSSARVLRDMETHLLVRIRSVGPGTQSPHHGEREDEHGGEQQSAYRHAVAVLVVLERRLVHVQAGHHGRRARAAVGEQQDRHEVLHREDARQDHHDPELRHQQRDIDREHPPEGTQAVQPARVQ